MIVVVGIIILAAVFITVAEVFRRHQENKYWIRGYEYIKEDFSGLYVTARLISDPEKNEFTVKLDIYDDMFYDIDRFSYTRNEILIKKEQDEEEK